jgi:hypothetical protein
MHGAAVPVAVFAIMLAALCQGAVADEPASAAIEAA